MRYKLELVEGVIVGVEQCHVGSNRHLDAVVVEMLDQSLAVGLAVDPLLESREVILSVGVLDVGEQLSSLTGKEQASSQQVTGRPHSPRVHVGLRERATTQENRDFVRVDPVVLGFAPMNRFHEQCVSEHEGEPFLRTKVGQPVPAEQALDGDHQIVAVGNDDLQESLALALQIPMDQDFTGLVQDADIHRRACRSTPQ